MSFDAPIRHTVHQCTHQVSDSDDTLLTSILGSCVAACVYDPVLKVGGMNHILLPGKADSGLDTRTGMYGSNLMELLLNDMFKMGASKKRLEVKLFGGAAMGMSALNTGKRNVDFIKEFVRNEGLNVISESLGGSQGRRIEFHPVTGKTRQRLLDEVSFEKTEMKPPRPAPVVPEAGSMELF